MERFLTKSRFKLGLECETKLYYTRKKEYADQSIDNPFLIELAKGGYQVGELAKFYITSDAQKITVEEMDYYLALNETQKRINKGDRYIAEAAIRFENLFIRVDIFEIDLSKKEICIYEVKSVSYKSDEQFIKESKKGNNKGNLVINNDWLPYLTQITL